MFCKAELGIRGGADNKCGSKIDTSQLSDLIHHVKILLRKVEMRTIAFDKQLARSHNRAYIDMMREKKMKQLNSILCRDDAGKTYAQKLSKKIKDLAVLKAQQVIENAKKTQAELK